jgi:hypothetical protein
MARYCETDFVNYVCRGGFFGGNKELVHQFNALYYNLLESSLREGLMGADECIFTILSHKHSKLVNRFELSGNGLVWPFFEELKNYTSEKLVNDTSLLNPNNTALYVITFNSPKQFETLIKSMLAYDGDYISRPKLKILLNNSTNLETTERYQELCDEYGFTHIKKDNVGICGGRQWIAEHFETTNLDYYLFFEDDMFFYPNEGKTCKNGFNRFVPNLYKKSLDIVKKENFDFLKLNYSEFFGDNGTQWSWYNVPQDKREFYWPNKKTLPKMGLDPDAPKTLYNSVLSHQGVPYTKGEVYYCNWPQIVSRPGNKKMFLATKWAHPYEQTWMSYMYELTKNGELNPGLLLITPTEHDRFEHYDRELRKES